MEKYLPRDFLPNKYSLFIKATGGFCCLTGETEDLQVDHFIPQCWGHGGATFYENRNLYILARRLNARKNYKIPFEWIKEKEIILQIDLSRWRILVETLAESHSLTVEEFTEYVYWCAFNSRTVEDLMKDNTPSIFLWRKAYSFPDYEELTGYEQHFHYLEIVKQGFIEEDEYKQFIQDNGLAFLKEHYPILYLIKTYGYIKEVFVGRYSKIMKQLSNTARRQYLHPYYGIPIDKWCKDNGYKVKEILEYLKSIE